MGLFGFLKSKRPIDTTTTDSLLREAMNNPAMLPDFYRSLLAEELIICVEANQFPDGRSVVKEDTPLTLKIYEQGALGVFTSPERLTDNKAVRGGDLRYLIFQGRIALMKTRGNGIIVNPYAEHHIALEPDEVNELLQGNLYIGNRNLSMKQPEISQNR